MHRMLSAAIGSLMIVFAAGCSTQPAAQADAGWVTLIDGANGLDNWSRVGDANWQAANGAIQADRKSGKDAGFLVSRNAYTDFQIRAEFWVSDDANSGIFLRCAEPTKPGGKTCYEVNIYDQRPDPSYGTGAIVYVAPVSPMPKAGGKWNTYDITVKGNHLTVVLNGQRTVDAQDSKLASGPVALQYDGGIVKFRKVQIRPL